MKKIRLLNLGDVPAVRSQTVYHAAARALREETPDTLIVVSPSQPYVSIGYHQELEKEVDLDYCRAHGLPIIRREVGGGAVYLDNGQVFIQWVFHGDSLPRSVEERFALYARPLVETYREMGIEAYYRPINDIHVNGKKICGTGAAQIGASEVVVGSLMFDFDKATMARVLKVPSEKMRDKVFESLEQYMVTLRELLGRLPDRKAVTDLYVQKCAEVLQADVQPGQWAPEEEAIASKLDEQFVSDEWLSQKGGLHRSGIKIHQDVQVVEKAYKAPGGLIRVTARLHSERIDDLVISGDFTILPAHSLGALEQALQGAEVQPDPLEARIQGIYRQMEIQSPGVTPEDIAQAILAAVG